MRVIGCLRRGSVPEPRLFKLHLNTMVGCLYYFVIAAIIESVVALIWRPRNTKRSRVELIKVVFTSVTCISYAQSSPVHLCPCPDAG